VTALALPPRGGPARTLRRSILHILSITCFVSAAIMLGKASWIHVKAQVAQVLMERAFTRSLASGDIVKAWNWADTWPVAKVSFPRLGEEAIVLQGASGEALAFGPALLNETSRPGERGTSVIAAHRDTHFSFLRDVKVHDEIAIVRNDGLQFRYRVTNTRVVEWNTTGIDRHAPGFNLVLSTCYPFDAVTRGTQRYIVEAVMVR
jgi:sortase A